MASASSAPRDLPAKERAAVEAGLEILRTVPNIDSEGTKLSVGVGIATGDAFVGNIEAADRMIWSAIGDCVNLAARLEARTRDLDAGIVIDDPTWERAGDCTRGFEKVEGTRIRGRSDALTIHHLPLET